MKLFLIHCVVFVLCAEIFSQKKVFFGFTQGYTQYSATDLNRSFVLLEKMTQDLAGFNNYDVQQLDGHPINSFVIGYHRYPFTIGLEYEYWSENFAQKDVPFDGGDRVGRITCADVRAPDFVHVGNSGCLDAEENFFFAPTLLFISYHYAPFKFLSFGLGYGAGVLAGSSEIKLAAEYLGEDARQADAVKVELYPGINLNQKFFADMEINPWKYIGLNIKGGYRLLEFDEIEIRNMQGQSDVFDFIFNSPQNGDKLYITSTAGGPNEDELIIGSTEEANLAPRAKKVAGQFSGWFINVTLILNWSFGGA